MIESSSGAPSKGADVPSDDPGTPAEFPDSGIDASRNLAAYAGTAAGLTVR